MSAHAGLWSDSITDVNGNGRPNTLIEVVLAGTTTLATLYTDVSKSTQAPNPFTTTSLGNASFYADWDVALELHVPAAGGLPEWRDPVRVFPHAGDVAGIISLDLVKDFGVKFDGSDQTQRVLDAVAAMPGGSTFTFGVGGGVLGLGDATLLIPDGLNPYGAGAGKTTPGTLIRCLSAASRVAFGSGAVGDNRGGVSGNFIIDANNVATQPLYYGRIASRLFAPTRVQNLPAGAIGALIEGSQNCKWDMLEIAQGVGVGTLALVLDYGCGGLQFDVCHIRNIGGVHLTIRQSDYSSNINRLQPQGTPGNVTGLYSQPEQIKFMLAVFEQMVPGVTQLMVDDSAGRDIEFDTTVFAATDANAPFTIARITNPALYGAVSTGITFNNPKFSGDAAKAYVTFLDVAASTAISAITGHVTPVNIYSIFKGVAGAIIDDRATLSTTAPYAHLWDPASAGAQKSVLSLPHRRLLAEKVIDEPPVNNSLVVVNDSELFLPVEANAEYELRAYIIYDASTTADCRMEFTGPTGATAHITPNCLYALSGAGGTIAQINKADLDLGVPFQAGGTNVGLNVVATPEGTVKTDVTSGTLRFKFAQWLAEASNVTIHAGSWIELVRVA